MRRLALPLALLLLLSACSLPATRPADPDLATGQATGLAAPAVETCPSGDDDGIGGTGCRTD